MSIAPVVANSAAHARAGRRVSLIAVAVLCGLGAVAAALWIDPVQADPEAWFAPLLLAGYRGLPLLALLLALLALTGRAVAALFVACGFQAVVVAISAIKLEQIGLPLLPADFRFLGHQGGTALFAHYMDFQHVAIPLGLLAAAVAAWLIERRMPRLAWRARGTIGLFALLLGASLWQGWSPWRVAFERGVSGFAPWSPADSAARTGAVTTLLMYHWTLSRPSNVAPDRDRILEFVAEHASEFSAQAGAAPGAVFPDIVLLQSESFFDPVRLAGIDAKALLPNFKRLAARGVSGELDVPTYGGGTIRTEFEVLTGVPLAAFTGVEYPYFEILDAPIPSLASNLLASGYQTLALHPNDAGFWNRAAALQNLGIERFVAGVDFADAAKDGLFVADSALTDRMLAELPVDGPPRLLFAISMQAHGPYEFSPGRDADLMAQQPVPDSLDEYGARSLRNYLYHLASADRELGRLADALLCRRRPTLLVFYGDHLPGLHSSFAQLGFVDGAAPRKQKVPFLIVDNRTAEARSEDLAAWMLPAVLLEAAHVPQDAYFALIGGLRHSPRGLLDDGPGARPEARFAELARLRVRGEFDADELVSAASGRDDAQITNVLESVDDASRGSAEAVVN